jgi:hypothetical protein
LHRQYWDALHVHIVPAEAPENVSGRRTVCLALYAFMSGAAIGFGHFKLETDPSAF